MKPGTKTTEFWLTIVANVAGVLLLLTGVLLAAEVIGNPEKTEQLASTLVTVGTAMLGLSNTGYAVSRGIAKHRNRDDSRPR